MRQPTFFMDFRYDYTGNLSLLDKPTVAFFASRVVSPAVEEQALRWAEACCATDRVVISGFQSPLEKSVFELLLKARHPVIWALGRALYRRYPHAVEEALTEQRILIFCCPQCPSHRLADSPNPQLRDSIDGRRERLCRQRAGPHEFARSALWSGGRHEARASYFIACIMRFSTRRNELNSE